MQKTWVWMRNVLKTLRKKVFPTPERPLRLANDFILDRLFPPEKGIIVRHFLGGRDGKKVVGYAAVLHAYLLVVVASEDDIHHGKAAGMGRARLEKIRLLAEQMTEACMFERDQDLVRICDEMKKYHVHLFKFAGGPITKPSRVLKEYQAKHKTAWYSFPVFHQLPARK